MGPDRGTVVVCINSTRYVFSANATQYRRGVLRTWEVTPGTYTVQVIALANLVSDPVLGQVTGATDLDGLAVNGAVATTGIYDDANTSVPVQYLGTASWTALTGQPVASNGTLHYSDTANDFSRFTFKGTKVRYRFTKGPNRTSAAITIDGQYVTTLNLYAPSYSQQIETWESGVLDASVHTVHTIHLQVQAAPAQYPDRTRIAVDGFEVVYIPPITPTNTPTKTPTATATRTPTPTATRTATPIATATPVPPTATSTATPIGISTGTPVDTVEPSATGTLVPPTATGTAEPSATSTSTTEPTATGTAEPSATGTATPTDTAEPSATGTAEPTATASPAPLASTRVVTYAYDGLQRLTDAVESPGTSYRYAYDLAGNRTDVWQNGTLAAHQDYNAANQVQGWAYDEAGNLTNDGTSTYSYDALGRMTARGATTYSYNGDSVLIDDGTTRYTQDLASPLSQILQTTQDGATANHLYGLDRLASVAGSTRSWYSDDALGSVRQTTSDAGTVLGTINYDPWGGVENGTVPTFGFTGECGCGTMSRCAPGGIGWGTGGSRRVTPGQACRNGHHLP